jgi:predicted nucleic acid-binding protein
VSRTFVDSSVFIAAAEDERPASDDARRLLADPNRWFVASSLVELEVLPPPPGRHREAQGLVRATFLGLVAEWLEVDQALVREAAALRRATPGLGPMDSLHAAAAIRAGAELVTLEAVTKPLYAVAGLRVVHVSAAGRGP